MTTQLIKSESSLWTNFKRTMYAIMVIVITISIPLLSYMELTHNDNTNEPEVIIKVENIASSSLKGNTVKL